MFKVAIIGSGPSGLSAAAHACELGVSHVLLESEQHPADTIYKYQKGKYVMAEPNVLPLRSPMSFKAGRREEILGAWDTELGKYGVNIRFGAGVTAIEGTKGQFTIKTADGKSVAAEAVVLAIGLQGNLRKLGAPGENLPIVQYQLDDPKAYEDETIIVIGAGDAAIENAIALAEQNRVIMINRNEEFARCKDGNLMRIAFIYISCCINKIMSNTCDCGSCGHETTEECFNKECKCCLPDHLGAFGKNR